MNDAQPTGIWKCVAVCGSVCAAGCWTCVGDGPVVIADAATGGPAFATGSAKGATR